MNTRLFALTTALLCLAPFLASAQSPSGPAVALRVEHFIVPPATGPVTHVVVQNLRDTPYEGIVQLDLPEGWQWSPREQPVALGPEETARVPFTIEKATNLSSNTYPVTARATGPDTEEVVRKQSVVCASAPYFRPEIDGKLKEWCDALPVRFTSGDKQTTVYTYWNRRAFCLAVAVEEDAHQGPDRKTAGQPIDAIQFALAPRTAETGSADTDLTARYEFLAAGGKKPACFSLIQPGTALSTTQAQRPLPGLKLPGAEVAVKRTKGVTYYECTIPFAAMPDIRPAEGREFRFSILIHDPDGTGLRDWGEAAGLWPSQRNKYAWCNWAGAQWGKTPPYDGKIEWGLCSSIH